MEDGCPILEACRIRLDRRGGDSFSTVTVELLENLQTLNPTNPMSPLTNLSGMAPDSSFDTEDGRQTGVECSTQVGSLGVQGLGWIRV